MGRHAYADLKTSDTPFKQWRFPVGCGPSSKIWPKWLPQRRQCTSVRSRNSLRSGFVPTAFRKDL
jgi:hypothetical protein